LGKESSCKSGDGTNGGRDELYFVGSSCRQCLQVIREGANVVDSDVRFAFYGVVEFNRRALPPNKEPDAVFTVTFFS